MPDSEPVFKAMLRRHDVLIASIVVVMIIIFSALSRTFLSPANLVGLLENYSVVAMMAAGLFAGLLLALIPGGRIGAQGIKTHKVGALTKSLANPYFLLMEQGYEYAQKKLGVAVVFGSKVIQERPAARIG